MALDEDPRALDEQFEKQVVCSSEGELDFRNSAIEFRHLRYFICLAEELHFGRAAARLFISQSGLSQSIAALERALDVRLFERTRNRVQPTDGGLELLHHARRLLADRASAAQHVRSIARGTGLVRLGVAFLAEPEVAPMLTALRSEHPGIAVDQTAAGSERLLAHVRDGGLQAAFVHQVPALLAFEDVEWEIVRRGQLCVLVSVVMPIAHRPAVRLSELGGETFLVDPRVRAPSAVHGLRLMCMAFGGFDPAVTECIPSSSLRVDSDWGPVAEGLAIAVVTEGTARALRTERIVAIPVEPPPGYTIALAWRRGERATVVHRFLRFVRAYRDEYGWLDQ